jgi:putative ABC transport system permease protein
MSDLGASSGTAIVGESVRINGAQFLVIGVLAPKGQTGGFQNPDDQVLIPVQTAQARLMGGDRLRSLNVLAPSEDQIAATMAEVTRILRREHHLRTGDPDDFTIRNQTDFLTTLGETTQVFTMLLAGIAAVSLIVGGIGIMNIMLVSVTERTREIGVRKALGATRLVILTQFLIEAVTLCLLGGSIGVALGAGVRGAARRVALGTSVGVDSVALAFGFGRGGAFCSAWPAGARDVIGPDRGAALRVVDTKREPARTCPWHIVC